MGTVFAYARVSTPDKEKKGVSLVEQRDAIARYSERHGLEIVRWFEEQESASKKGRPAFNQDAAAAAPWRRSRCHHPQN